MVEPKFTALTLGSGIDVLVKPLSPFVFQKLRSKAAELFPSPDEKAYETEPDPELMAIPGDKIPGSQNPDYQKAALTAQTAQNDWLTLAVTSLACEFSEPHDALIARFAWQLEQLSGYVDLPPDAWEATLYYAILTSEVERQMIVAAAESKLALTEGEIAEGRRLFRPVVSLEDIGRLATRRASRLSGGLPSQP